MDKTGNYFRAYTFRCVCGLRVKGFYRITKAASDSFSRRVATIDIVPPPLDKDKAICRMFKGKAAGQLNSTTADHDVGCGLTLAQVDAKNEEARLMRRAAASS